MNNSSPTQSDSIPFLKTALILLLLHPLTGARLKKKNQRPLRSILLQIIGRCVRRANRAQLKTLPIVVPLLLPHLVERELFEKIISDLQVDLRERLRKHASSPNYSTLYNDPLTANLLIVFDFLYLINESFHALSYSGRCSPSQFYHRFPDDFSVCEDYARWRELEQVPDRHLPFAFCDFPWILDLELKGVLLGASNGLKQRHHLQDSFFRAIFDGMQSTSLNLMIRRGELINDARDQLFNQPEHQLSKQLKVTFDGEEGVDEGGLKKEFFQLCWNELFIKRANLFKEFESGCFWFNSECQEGVEFAEDYKFIGTILALAIYNGVLVAPSFPLLLFKKLLNWPLLLDDYAEIDAILTNSIHRLEDEDCLSDLYHLVPGSEIELIPNGADILVTPDSLQSYTNLLSDYLLNRSVSWQFNAFRMGFESIARGSVIYGYRPDELFALSYGSDNFDISQLVTIATYEGGYTPHTPQILWLWDCLIHRFNLQEQRHFLAFLTGSPKAPLSGLTTLKSITITKGSAGDSDRLPTAHTCFNTLLLPEYGCCEKLEDKLRLSIIHHKGFGLI